MAVNVILNSEYNVYANIFDNDVGEISYPTRNFLYNSNSSNLFADCNKLKMDLGQMKGNWSLVTNMARSFYNCTNITGVPFFPTNVVNIINTYYNCYLLTGNFPQSINVNNMYGTFYNCQKLTGNPSSGNNLVDISYCYYNISSMAGTIYLNYNGTAEVNAINAFYGRDTNKKLYIQVKPNSKWNNWFYNNCSIYGNILNWIPLHNRYYNLDSSTIVRYGDGYGDVYLNQLNFKKDFNNNGIQTIYLLEMDNDVDFTSNNINSYWIHNDNSTEFMKLDKLSKSILSSAPFSEINIYFNSNCYAMMDNQSNLNFNLVLGNTKGTFRGEYITNLQNAFQYCSNLHFSIENFNLSNCISMHRAFSGCKNLVGPAICGDNVTNMHMTYDNCHNLAGPPVCGNNVTIMYGAYYNCYNITGPAVCGDNVTNMEQAYCNCYNITSAIFGNSVTLYNKAYQGCNNIEKIIINCPTASGITQAFTNSTLNSVTNIYFGGNCKNAYNTFDSYSGLNNTFEVTIDNPVENIGRIFRNCFNAKIIINNISDSVTNMHAAFARCYNLIGLPTCGDNVTSMYATYYDCHNITGSPVCGNNVTNMYATYYNCYNITGSPVCGNNVTIMYATYSNCHNMIGPAACGDKVIDMTYAYLNCYNITSAIFGNSVTSYANAYQGCNNIEKIIINCANTSGIVQAFTTLNNVTNIYFGGNCENACNTFNNCSGLNNTFEVIIDNPVTDISSIFRNCQNAKIIINNISDSVTNMYGAYYNCHNMIGPAACGNNVTNMYVTYANCYNMTGSPVCGNNVTDMYATYYDCHNITGSPACGDNVTNMYATYQNCYNMTGPAACGNYVTNIAYAYYNCHNITGSPACGNNVTNMWGAYTNCYNMTGSAVCGDNVTVMNNAYSNCYNITSAIFGNLVTSYANAYRECNNIKEIVINCANASGIAQAFTNSTLNNVTNIYFGGNCKNACNAFNNYSGLNSTFEVIIDNPVTDISNTFRNCRNAKIIVNNISDSIKNMFAAFSRCYNLIGPALCGNNVTNMYSGYQDCHNMIGPAACGDKVIDMTYAYLNCYNITSAIFGNSVTSYSAAYQGCNSIEKIIINCANASGITQAFTAGVLNNVTNIYFGGNCKNACNAFNSYSGLNNTFEVTIDNPVEDISNMFRNCYNAKIIINNIGNSVTNMKSAFSGCYNLIGPAVCGDNVTSIVAAYNNCRNLIGSPVCGDKVINMWGAYQECYNMTGPAICGNKVTNMYMAYYNCYNMTGSPVCGNNVINMVSAYANCYNITGNIIIPTSVTNLAEAFRGCVNLSSIVIPHSTSIAMNNMSLMCQRGTFTKQLNIIVANKTTFTTLRKNSQWANASFSTATAHSETITVDGIDYIVKNYAYNTEKNVYLYCLNA